jgi:hypothetical protein
MTPSDDTTTATAAASFDVREFARTARGSHRSELDLSELAKAPLPADAARLIRILRDLERATMQRMRNLLVTATHKDARVTAFLTTWAFERFWIADALDYVLETAGEPLENPDTGRARKPFAERAERRGPIRRAVAAGFAGSQLVAAHVTAGLVDEWVVSAAYRRLSSAAASLKPVVELVLSLKERHIRFLSEEAERRLAASPRAQRLTRRELTRSPWPIGALESPAEDRSFFETFVFGTADGRAEAARIGELVAALPGIGSGVGSTLNARLVP